jgi:hypothetical protein
VKDIENGTTFYAILVAVLFGALLGACTVYFTRPKTAESVITIVQTDRVASAAAAALLTKAAEVAAKLAIEQTKRAASPSISENDRRNAAEASALLTNAAAAAADLVAMSARTSADIASAIAVAAENAAKTAASTAKKAQGAVH